MSSPSPRADAPTSPQDVLPSPAGGQRAHPRVTVPFTVRFHKETYRVENIGLGGFCIKHPYPAQVSTLPTIARLSLSLADVTVSIVLPIREVWHNEDGIRSFEFLALTQQQAALLNRIVEDHLANQVTVVDDLIAQPDGSASKISSAPAAQSRPRARFSLLALLLALCAAIALLAVLVAAPIFSVGSTVAAVATQGTLLRAPATGVLNGPALQSGSVVHRGDVLFEVQTPASITQTAALAGERERLDTELREEQLQSDEVTSLASHLVTVSRAKRNSVRLKIAAIDSQIATASALLEKMKALVKDGYVSPLQLNAQEIALESLRRSRQEGRAELIAAESEETLATSGSLRTERAANMQTIEVMGARIDAAKAAVAGTDRRLAALTRANQITSPCDCIVHTVMATPGDVVTGGALVYALRPRDTPPVIDALISSERVHELHPGALATIAFPDHAVRGRLVSISYLASNSARLGLPQKVDVATSDAGERMATAIIVPDEKLDPTLVGNPVRVYIESNPLTASVARFAMIFQ